MLLRSAVLFTTLAFGVPAATAATESTTTSEIQPASAPTVADHGDSASYAQREQHDTHAADYQGGGVIVVGISGTAVLLFLLLLLLL